ncbi:MAG: putative Na+/H+ antiporter [Proteobacteria bacterium]|nr:putative Na+/H+ antiporter [Pseudomonadota bacterium]
MTPSNTELIAAALFALAIAHTFLAPKIAALGHRWPRHEGLFHLFGEVEAVFGLWSAVLLVVLGATGGFEAVTRYIDGRNFTEPLFVIAIMVVAASKPVLHVAKLIVTALARLLPLPRPVAFCAIILTVVPLLGSFITEPAAMTLGAFMLRDRFYRAGGLSSRLRYGMLGVLFVNVSIGGVLTPFAAPPVLMVAAKWDWNIAFMLTHFGWRAALAVLINATVVSALFFHELRAVRTTSDGASEGRVPPGVCAAHLLLLAGVVVFAHHPPLFLGCLLAFLGLAHAYPQHQDRLILREALMVGFFLAGLVVLGGMQQWWLQELLLRMSPNEVYFGATALTAITDNAALTYLGSLVSGLTPEFKYMLVAGAVTGGGLTVIANAPNPAGYAILKPWFEDGHISALGLFVAAFGPTLTAIVCFWALPR